MNIDSQKCIACRKCIDKCPVKYPNKYTSKGVLYDYSNCINCGNCIDTCNMRKDNFNIDFNEYNNKDYCILIHPAFKYNYKYKSWISKLNNLKYTIYDGGFGGDIYLGLTHNLILSNLNKLFIAPLCPTIGQYFQKYIYDNKYTISPISNPIELMCTYIKKVIQDNRKIILISPCISYEYCVDKLVLINNLPENNQFILDDRINCPATLGDYLMISGNVTKCLNLLGYNQNVLEINNCLEDLDNYISSNNLIEYFIPIKCNSCLNKDSEKFNIELKLLNSINKFEPKKLKSYKEKINKFNLNDYLSNYSFIKIRRYTTDTSLINNRLDYIKNNMNYNYIDCGKCGYRSCKEFITACNSNYDDFSNCIVCKETELRDLYNMYSELLEANKMEKYIAMCNKNEYLVIFKFLQHVKSDINLMFYNESPDKLFDILNKKIENQIKNSEKFLSSSN